MAKMTFEIPAEIKSQVEANETTVAAVLRAALRKYAVQAKQSAVDVTAERAAQEVADIASRAERAKITAKREQAIQDAETLLARVQ